MPASNRPVLYAHPFSSYCQKVLVALYENGTPFEFRLLEGADALRELEALWPMKRFPVLRDGERTLIEASIIVEHLDLHRPGPVRLLPSDPREALEVRFMDRFFDNYVSTPQQKVVFDRLRPEAARDPQGVAEARAMLDKAYAWLDARMAAREWAVLEVLLARVERIVSKESIIQAVASWGEELTPNAIEVYVSRLRAKLEPSGVRIRTVRGFGYMLEEYREQRGEEAHERPREEKLGK